jgi:hypothetical protein
VAAGRLVEALPGFPVPELWVKALIPESRVGLARIEALIAWLKAALSPVPPWEVQAGAVSGASS